MTVKSGSWIVGASLLVAGCVAEPTGPDRAPRNDPFLTTAGVQAPVVGSVQDVSVMGAGESTITLSWSQVDDGMGSPAQYRLKYAPPPINWRTGTVGCDVVGDQIGAVASCTVRGLAPGTSYDFQLMSHRVENGVWAGALYSNVAVGQTSLAGTGGDPDPQPAPFVVSDLSVATATDHFVTLTWTQVDDGTGSPAWYRVKYAEPPVDWKTATIGCDPTIEGDEIGAEISCSPSGLAPSTTYEFRLMSFRMVGGVWQDAHHSNVTSATTAPAVP